jgi:hypothetical protein
MDTPQPFSVPGNSSAQVWEGAKKLAVYADPWTTPPEAFCDIYDLQSRLCTPDSHLQMDGRRGTGKTVLMVNSYLKLRRQFEETKGSPPYTVAIYVDLSQDVGTPHSNPPMVRGYLLYQQILKLILTASGRPGHRRDRRFWGLQDYLNERPQWFRRVFARMRLDRYRQYAENVADLISQDAQLQHILRAMRGESINTHPANLRIARMAMPKSQAQTAQPTRARPRGLPPIVYEKRLLNLYRNYGAQTRDYLESVLDALQIERLILFIDEWSGPSIGSDTQPYLYEQLAHTFVPGGRVVLRLATIPGATKLTFDGSGTLVPVVRLDQLASFQPNWMRRRLLRMLIMNLAVTMGDHFPGLAYLTEEQEKAGFPLFLHDVFYDADAADELLRASESLPRQMLLQFMAAVQLRSLYRVSRKLTAGQIRMAAAEHFSSQLAVTIRQDALVSAVFDRLLKAGCRVVDVERVPAFYEALDWLTNEGIIFRADAAADSETTYVEGFLRYRLSYPADVYRLAVFGRPGTPRLETYDQLQIENVIYPERYANPPKVMLTRLAAMLE